METRHLVPLPLLDSTPLPAVTGAAVPGNAPPANPEAAVAVGYVGNDAGGSVVVGREVLDSPYGTGDGELSDSARAALLQDFLLREAENIESMSITSGGPTGRMLVVTMHMGLLDRTDFVSPSPVMAARRGAHPCRDLRMCSER